jgi:hypothetical protein
MKNLWRY